MCFAVKIFDHGIWVNGDSVRAIRGEYRTGDKVTLNNCVWLVVAGVDR